MTKDRNSDKDNRKAETRSIEELASELMNQIKENAARGRFVPKADAWESDTAYFISIYLPGLEKKDVSMEVKDGHIMIFGERELEPELSACKMRLMQSDYGYFQRRIKLNPKADVNNMRARMENGILRIVIPKHQAQEYEVKTKVA
jgi:HSP20 family protein